MTTLLDKAHADMQAAGDADAARLRFFGRVADAELSLVLEDRSGDTARPRLFEVEGTRYALAFDTELRMVDFCGDGVEYISGAGRQLAGLMAGQGIGLALNLGAPSATLLPAQALDWLTETLAEGPSAQEDRPVAVHPPRVPEPLLAALDEKLAILEGLARAAWLVAFEYEGARRSHALVFVDPGAGAAPALATAVNEALRFSGQEMPLDVTFLPADAPLLGPVSRNGLRFDLPQPRSPGAPGRDPDRPPKLR